MASRPTHGNLIHCASCGEDYSDTYKRCPFCGAKNDVRYEEPPKASDEEFDDGYVFDGQELFDGDQEGDDTQARPKGGKRLAGNQGREPSEPVNWPRLITFLCSLAIIIAALIIVFTVIYPQLRGGKDPNVASSEPVLEQPSDPVSDPTTDPSTDPVGDPTAGITADPAVSADLESQPPESQAPSSDMLSGFKLNRMEFTLKAGESFKLQPTFTPSDWSGTVTWSSSDERYATVNASGNVTNVNATNTLHGIVVTATAGGISVECKVYCRGVPAEEPTAEPTVEPTDTPSAEPTENPEPSVEPTQQPSTAPSGNLTPGAKGVIAGADGGLRVRSGPGTSYEVLASLVNGSAVTIVADAGDGWYQITFSGSGGAATNGYILGQYISVN